ncbi:ISNCY-like element ISPa4 family transposase [Pseudomonas aeruginosa]|uniref:ISNCY-like element ISPa4 family transposase n=1 Tax=Pseudomonas aeruginosa TaxID=287 RepID=UPI0004998BEB|nr:ISNCY-like element ISPa4 family transposase [Pseudomonas aeruginosa]HCL2794953.1 ISNCY-like element ISPa4 family transposase [Pseudomonas aeruginosa 7D9A]MBG4634312.1 ISNCY-like element ISPa4 family transposase [Pseudomonas aeruginosa]MBH8999576.1 ISNCY-like element ISPa4 family transposase [Pseudomonas aeruginosa]MBI8765733.1 ISNCY-like element ISPa4 family transposase [Pseudomonas aeruginosa]MCO2367908.1 ISNCY-like element ISPa4 family transposase [Pseudomonas aeruginosa]
MANKTDNLPDFLQDYASLFSHFQGQMDGLTTVQIGDKFASLAEHLIPHTEAGSDFERATKSKKSWDKGVDLIFQHKEINGVELRVQSKYTISSVDDVDLIISKFQEYDSKDATNKQHELDLLGSLEEDSRQTSKYLIITSSKILNIIAKFLESQRPSRFFLERIKKEKRFHYIDGIEILTTIQSIYRSTYIRPQETKLIFQTPHIRVNNVYIGVLPCNELRRVYEEAGDSIFFENIREWLGFQGKKVKSGGVRETVNEAIASTLEDSPEKMLERNNGIVIRASQVEETSNSSLKLRDASIVNGCQTTMSVFFVNPADGHVLAKIVETEDSWEIAKAANFQTEIERIELELARYLRPQLARSVGAENNFKFDQKEVTKGKSAFALLDQIYKDEICYDELKSIFIGLFSRSANNAISPNYTELRIDVLQNFERDSEKSKFLEALFVLHSKSSTAMESLKDGLLKPEIMDLFKRFWKEDKPSYRAFVTLLAIFSALDKKNRRFEDYNDIKSGIIKLAGQIEIDPGEYIETYIKAFKTIALDVLKGSEDKDKMLQSMYHHIGSMNFENALLSMSLL